MTTDTATNADDLATSLCPEGFSRWPDVERLVRMGRETDRVREKRGTFPRRVALGPRTAAWRNADLLTWLRNPAGYRAPDEANLTAALQNRQPQNRLSNRGRP